MKKVIPLIYTIVFMLTAPLSLKAQWLQANETPGRQNRNENNTNLTCPKVPLGYGDFPVQVPAALPVNAFTKPGYQLVFDDEFGDTSVSTQNWNVSGIVEVFNDPVKPNSSDYWLNVPAPYNDNVVGNRPLENYFIDPETKDLKLRVTALDSTHFKYGPYTPPVYLPPHYTGNPSYSFGLTFDYSAALILTNSIFYHGYFEIEAKLPPPGNSYPSYWFNNSEEHFNYPSANTHREMDVIDDSYYPITSAYPFGYLFSNTGYAAVACAFAAEADTLVDLSKNFHLYALDWQADSIKYLIDNQVIISFPNVMPYDGRTQLILANSVGYELGNYPETGLIPGQNDFEIKYVRAWQKTDDIFNWYFVNMCDVYAGGIQVWNRPGGFFATPDNYPPYTYAVETDFINGSSYTWKSSDSSKLILDPPPSTWSADSFAENGSRCYFHGTTPGNYSIYLTATLPASLGGITENRTIPITILPDSLSTPIIHYILDSANCNYRVYVDTVPGAMSYTWSNDGIHWSVPLPDMCPAAFAIQPDSSYHISVQAFYIACNGEQLSSPVATISGKVPPYKCDTAKKHIVYLQNLIKAYPSPSDGHLWIENDFATDVTVTLWLDTGALLGTFTLNSGEKTETDNLPEGMILLEAVRNDNHEIAGHKLLPVFRH